MIVFLSSIESIDLLKQSMFEVYQEPKIELQMLMVCLNLLSKYIRKAICVIEPKHCIYNNKRV